MKFLIVDDNFDIQMTLTSYLEFNNIQVDSAYNSKEALHLLQKERFDLIIMDIMMPHLSGIDATRLIRDRLKIQTPILFLTARDGLADKTKAFEAGGDDYLVKPFELKELMLRAQALLKRSSGAQVADFWEYKNLKLSAEEPVLWIHQQSFSLSKTHYCLLKEFLQAPQKVLAQNELIDSVWSDEGDYRDSLRSHIYSLRKFLEKHKSDAQIENRSGIGYVLV